MNAKASSEGGAAHRSTRITTSRPKSVVLPSQRAQRPEIARSPVPSPVPASARNRGTVVTPGTALKKSETAFMPSVGIADKGLAASASARMRPISSARLPSTGEPQGSKRVTVRLERKATAVIPLDGNRSSGPRWICDQCGIHLEESALATGNADLSDGRIVCGTCLRKQKSRGSSSKWPWVLGAAAAALAATVVAPQTALFVLTLVSMGCVLLAGLSYHWRNSKRIALAVGGLAAAAAGLFFLDFAREKHAQKEQAAILQEKAAGVANALKEDRVLDAQSQLAVLEAGLNHRGEEIPIQSARQTAAGMRAAVDGWYRSAYGNVSRGQQLALTQLFKAFGDRARAGGKRFPSIRFEEDRLAVAAVLDGASTSEDAIAGNPANRAALDEARSIVLFLFDAIPEVNSVEIELSVASPNEGPKALGVFTTDRQHMGSLQTGASLEETTGHR